MKTLSDGMKNLETRYSRGTCGDCGRVTTALWERFGKKLMVSCQECGLVVINDENRFK